MTLLRLSSRICSSLLSFSKKTFCRFGLPATKSCTIDSYLTAHRQGGHRNYSNYRFLDFTDYRSARNDRGAECHPELVSGSLRENTRFRLGGRNDGERIGMTRRGNTNKLQIPLRRLADPNDNAKMDSRLRGNDRGESGMARRNWIPAFAGMTMRGGMTEKNKSHF